MSLWWIGCTGWSRVSHVPPPHYFDFLTQLIYFGRHLHAPQVPFTPQNTPLAFPMPLEVVEDRGESLSPLHSQPPLLHHFPFPQSFTIPPPVHITSPHPSLTIWRLLIISSFGDGWSSPSPPLLTAFLGYLMHPYFIHLFTHV
jgi:hypothetical protein